MSIKSLRFNPFWNENSSYQQEGLIDMINFIKNNNINLSKWLEIGSYIGESAEIFLKHDFIKKLFCIDVWTSSKNRKYFMEFSEDTEQEQIKLVFWNRLEKEIESGRCIPIESISTEAFKNLKENFDVIYIDACHTYKDVLTDLFLWYTRLNVGGFMCGHDFIFDKKNGFYPSTMAIQDFITAITPYYGTYEFHTFKDGSWAFKKERPILDLKEYKAKFINLLKNK